MAKWIVILSLCGVVNSLYIPDLPNTTYELVGDINIGGLFPLHEAGMYGLCAQECLNIAINETAVLHFI